MNGAVSYRFYGRTPGLVFEPWIGGAFAEQPLRLFFVGHSHYGADFIDGRPDPDTTIQAVRMAMTQGGLRFFTGLMQMACGLHRDYVVWDAFYERIGFANLLQGSLDASRLAADPEHLSASVPTLCAVFEELAPTHVILCGEAVWAAFFKHDMLDGYACEGSYYWKAADKRSYFYAQHPSSGFSSERWAAIFGTFLARTGTPRSDLVVDAVRYRQPSCVLTSYDAPLSP